jgi:glycine C-acetyltransferase
VPPGIVGASLKVLDMLQTGDELRQRLWDNTARFRKQMQALGFNLAGAGHPIIPVMIDDAPLAQRFAERMLEEGIYVVGFFFPVVPKGAARIRTQISAAHSPEQLDRCIDAFARVGRELGVID